MWHLLYRYNLWPLLCGNRDGSMHSYISMYTLHWYQGTGGAQGCIHASLLGWLWGQLENTLWLNGIYWGILSQLLCQVQAALGNKWLGKKDHSADLLWLQLYDPLWSLLFQGKEQTFPSPPAQAAATSIIEQERALCCCWFFQFFLN